MTLVAIYTWWRTAGEEKSSQNTFFNSASINIKYFWWQLRTFCNDSIVGHFLVVIFIFMSLILVCLQLSFSFCHSYWCIWAFVQHRVSYTLHRIRETFMKANHVPHKIFSNVSTHTHTKVIHKYRHFYILMRFAGILYSIILYNLIFGWFFGSYFWHRFDIILIFFFFFFQRWFFLLSFLVSASVSAMYTWLLLLSRMHRFVLSVI